MGATAYAVGAAEPAGLTVGGRVLGHTVGTDVGGLCDSHAGAVFIRSFVRSFVRSTALWACRLQHVL